MAWGVGGRGEGGERCGTGYSNSVSGNKPCGEMDAVENKHLTLQSLWTSRSSERTAMFGQHLDL